MLHSRLAVIAALAVLFGAAAPPAFAQVSELDAFEPECVEACLLGFGDVPPECDCEAVKAAADKITAGSSSRSSLASLPTARGLVAEVEADYQARMASVDTYYFVESTEIEVPAELMGRVQRPTAPRMLFAVYTPTAARTQLPGQGSAEVMYMAMPKVVRYFKAALGDDGKKWFEEFSQDEIAALDPLNKAAAGILGNLSGALGALAGALTGDMGGGFAQKMADKLQGMQAGLFGGNGDDGFGMALEKEAIASLTGDQGGVPMWDVPVYLGWVRAQPGEDTSYTENEGTNCISLACGATSESNGAMFGWVSAITEMNLQETGVPSASQPAFVVRLDGVDNPNSSAASDIVFEGETYVLKSAEVWLIDASPDRTFTPEDGPSNNNLVPARRRIEYWRDGGNGMESIVFDRPVEGYGSPGPMVAPTSSTFRLEGLGDSGPVSIKKTFSHVTVNEDPTVAEVVDLTSGP